MKGKGT